MPEIYYFSESAEAWLYLALLITARCIVQWSDHYVAVWPGQASSDGSFRKGGRIEGDFGADLVQKSATLDAIFAEARRRQRPRPQLFLARGNQYLLFFDGLHFNLILSPEQFRTLQDCWEEHGLPRDLYYPIVQAHDGYTPRSWASWQESQGRAGHDAEREAPEAKIRSTGQQLARTVQQLRQHLSESSGGVGPELSSELSSLQQAVNRVLLMLPLRDQQSLQPEEQPDLDAE